MNREICKRLNDQLRTTFQGGRIILSAGATAIHQNGDLTPLLDKVRRFQDFNEDNDPWGEHDFGTFEHDGRKYFWKIDYYDVTFKSLSQDPSNPSVTRRVLTIGTTDDY